MRCTVSPRAAQRVVTEPSSSGSRWVKHRQEQGRRQAASTARAADESSAYTWQSNLTHTTRTAGRDGGSCG